MVHNLMAV